MNITWNGKKTLRNYGENLTEEQCSLASIVNSLETFKRELVPTSTMAGEIERIQSIALDALYKAGTHPDDIEWVGVGRYRLKDAAQ